MVACPGMGVSRIGFLFTQGETWLTHRQLMVSCERSPGSIWIPPIEDGPAERHEEWDGGAVGVSAAWSVVDGELWTMMLVIGLPWLAGFPLLWSVAWVAWRVRPTRRAGTA